MYGRDHIEGYAILPWLTLFEPQTEPELPQITVHATLEEAIQARPPGYGLLPLTNITMQMPILRARFIQLQNLAQYIRRTAAVESIANFLLFGEKLIALTRDTTSQVLVSKLMYQNPLPPVPPNIYITADLDLAEYLKDRYKIIPVRSRAEGEFVAYSLLVKTGYLRCHAGRRTLGQNAAEAYKAYNQLRGNE